jgi:hypothetical protein
LNLRTESHLHTNHEKETKNTAILLLLKILQKLRSTRRAKIESCGVKVKELHATEKNIR